MATAKKPTKPAKGTAKKPATKAPVGKAGGRAKPAAGSVLTELKSLAKELNAAAKGISRATRHDPKAIAATLGNVERMTADAANRSLMEAEAAKQILVATLDSLGKDWNRKEIDEALRTISAHLTHIIVAQEFQDLAGQAIRKAMKALVGAIVVDTVAGDDKKLSQSEADALMKSLMP
ncbi:MAG: protein phosphatase CheZ [Gammaproteobacteria bacterium]|nr:protein phosphatase CheZ [Gammaproteobacteria bacterium]MBU1645918.1 protein phosphatase CheZ [Gammaproteobacteria bacterium]MBU1971980.1 protein phosphatase CheZ [Gammaproteobacteria bacterium]